MNCQGCDCLDTGQCPPECLAALIAQQKEALQLEEKLMEMEQFAYEASKLSTSLTVIVETVEAIAQ